MRVAAQKAAQRPQRLPAHPRHALGLGIIDKARGCVVGCVPGSRNDSRWQVCAPSRTSAASYCTERLKTRVGPEPSAARARARLLAWHSCGQQPARSDVLYMARPAVPQRESRVSSPGVQRQRAPRDELGGGSRWAATRPWGAACSGPWCRTSCCMRWPKSPGVCTASPAAAAERMRATFAPRPPNARRLLPLVRGKADARADDPGERAAAAVCQTCCGLPHPQPPAACVAPAQPLPAPRACASAPCLRARAAGRAALLCLRSATSAPEPSSRPRVLAPALLPARPPCRP